MSALEASKTHVLGRECQSARGSRTRTDWLPNTKVTKASVRNGEQNLIAEAENLVSTEH